MIGQRYGKLVVIGDAEPKINRDGSKRRMCLCKCDCGNTKIISFECLRSGDTKSCGCIAIEKRTKHNNSGTRLYHIYMLMKDRCYNTNATGYGNYGGRGIRVCDEWLGENGFDNFYKWAISNGYNDRLSIDRINNSGNYEPNNCRWTTSEQQNNNKRNNHVVNYKGISLTVSQWAKLTGISKGTIRERLKHPELSVEEVLFKIPSPYGEKKVGLFKDNKLYKEFNSGIEAARYIGVSKCRISNCLKNPNKSIKGFFVRSLEQDMMMEQSKINEILCLAKNLKMENM